MKQGELWYAHLDPVKGSEQAGYRPVLVLSGNLLNTHAPVVICCPLTTKIKNYKGNLVLQPDAGNGLKEVSEVMVYHIRSVAKLRLAEKIGSIEKKDIDFLKNTLNEILTF